MATPAEILSEELGLPRTAYMKDTMLGTAGMLITGVDLDAPTGTMAIVENNPRRQIPLSQLVFAD